MSTSYKNLLGNDGNVGASAGLPTQWHDQYTIRLVIHRFIVLYAAVALYCCRIYLVKEYHGASVAVL